MFPVGSSKVVGMITTRRWKEIISRGPLSTPVETGTGVPGVSESLKPSPAVGGTSFGREHPQWTLDSVRTSPSPTSVTTPSRFPPCGPGYRLYCAHAQNFVIKLVPFSYPFVTSVSLPVHDPDVHPFGTRVNCCPCHTTPTFDLRVLPGDPPPTPRSLQWTS